MSTAVPTDPIEVLNPATPMPARQPTTRRDTILSLVEMLLRGDELPVQGQNQQPNFEDDRDVPTVDEHHQVVGAEAFHKLQRRIQNLDKELRNFANAARQLGSSVAILSSAFRLRERLAHILYLFRENAADLFPRKIQHKVPEAPIHPSPKLRRHRLQKRYKPPPNVARPIIKEPLDLEYFPDQLEQLASDVTTFLYCLNEFPEFTDEAVNACILSFEGDLKYWASCLKAYHGQFRYPAVQRYIHDLASEMGEHMDSITATLSMFIEIGVPTIRFAQKHGATNLLNLSTVATFFSAVTATTLQFSYQLDHADPVAVSVNCFWFASMVFSIAAAVNSLLGLTWKQAMYRSPGHRVPWWVLIWIKRSPLVFLVMSVACFSLGLCCFAYASHQAYVTSTITTVFTAFTSFGLAAVSAWFASERWIFLRHKGRKWLGDVLIDFNDQFMQLPGMMLIRQTSRYVRRRLRKVGTSLKQASSKTIGKLSLNSHSSDGADPQEDIESGILPIAHPHGSMHIHTSNGNHEPRPTDIGQSPAIEHKSPVTPQSPVISEKEIPVSSQSPSRGRQLWRHALRTVKMSQAMGPSSVATRVTPHRQRTSSSNLTTVDRKMMVHELQQPILRSRVGDLVPKLRNLTTVQELAPHSALVRHLQFSPDGRFLATSSWDRTSVIFRVAAPTNNPRVLAHPQGFVGQVAWSPSGNLLLTKMNRGFKIWTEDGLCKKYIDRNTAIESITWCPGGEHFMSVEGNQVVKLDLGGKILDTYDFGSMKLHDVGVTHDNQRLLAVGPLLQSPDGLQPSKSRAEKRLIVYNMEKKQIENQTPVFNEVRDITIARNFRQHPVALISYENKAPPQLWKLKLIKDRDNNAITTGRLELRHTYMPKVPVDFAGPSYFGGKTDELVLCAGKAGDIHIWDTESGALLHHVRAQVLGGDLTCIAWNHAAEDPYMFATGSHDGAVRIWTQPPKEGSEDDHDKRLMNDHELSRTSSPFGMYMQRTESPTMQQDYESQHSHSLESLSDAAQHSRERMVVFASNTDK